MSAAGNPVITEMKLLEILKAIHTGYRRTHFSITRFNIRKQTASKPGCFTLVYKYNETEKGGIAHIIRNVFILYYNSNQYK